MQWLGHQGQSFQAPARRRDTRAGCPLAAATEADAEAGAESQAGTSGHMAIREPAPFCASSGACSAWHPRVAIASTQVLRSVSRRSGWRPQGGNGGLLRVSRLPGGEEALRQTAAPKSHAGFFQRGTVSKDCLWKSLPHVHSPHSSFQLQYFCHQRPFKK